jgi:probable HAF family extracellular repeat protein
VDLGSLGGFGTSANAVNNAGQVVGQSDLAGSHVHHAFLWQDGQMTDLGTLGGDNSEATAINDAGQIVGYSDTIPGTASPHGFLYDNGTMIDLGTLGATYSAAYGINATGQVVGELDYLDGRPDVYHSFLYTDGTMIDLGSLGGTFSIAYGINAAGHVVGASAPNGSSPGHAYLDTHGVMADLGTFGGPHSEATRINDAGQVAGDADLDLGRVHAFLWQDGVLTDLGTLGGHWSVSSCLNQAGQLVGWSTIDDQDATFRGYLYRDGTMTDVNRLLPPDVNWAINFANGINDNGQIVGFGSHNMVPDRAYLLTLDLPGLAQRPLGRAMPVLGSPTLASRPTISTSLANEALLPSEWPSTPVAVVSPSTQAETMPFLLDQESVDGCLVDQLKGGAVSPGAEGTREVGAVEDGCLDDAARIA